MTRLLFAPFDRRYYPVNQAAFEIAERTRNYSFTFAQLTMLARIYRVDVMPYVVGVASGKPVYSGEIAAIEVINAVR